MDISHAQRLFELSGKIDRVDLIVNDEADFRSRWKSGFRIQSGRQRQATLRDMLQAFRLNLQALSLLALFVGVFLVYNTAMFTVVSRMKDAGILRSLGASRREIVGAFLSEILLLGSIGGVLGGLAGFLLSRFLSNLVAGTISNLYFFLRPAPLEWSWSVLLISVVLGCGASVLGGIFPLIELIRADPVQALRGRTAVRGTKGLAGKAALAGVGVLAISLGLFTLAKIHVYFGFAGSFALLIGVSLITGLVLVSLHPTPEKIPRPPVRASGESRRGEHSPKPRPYGSGRGRLHGGDFHVDRSELHDRELPSIAHLVDGHTAPGRSLCRESR